MDERVPLTLITGFLGSGKTTLVNRLLREREGLFVLVNEFGEVPLDHRLVEGRAEALAEGCLCCGLEGELVAALAALHRRGGFRHLLLETSGLAHPAPILRVLLAPGVREAYRLAGVVAVVDPLHLDPYLAFPEARAQIRYADLVLLSKADRAEPQVLEAAEEATRALNPLASIRRVAKGEGVDTQAVLFPRQEGGFRVIAPLPEHAHREGLVAVSFEREGALPYEAFRDFMEALVLSRGPFREGRLLRAKGEVNLEGSRHALRFHGVFGLFDFEKGPLWPPGPRMNRMVFIGENLPKEALQESFSRMFR